jgi:hypothetical protein
MERYPTGAAPDRTSAEYDRHMNDLVKLAESQTVMQRSAETLWNLRITKNPEVLLQDLQVRRVPNSNVLVIETTAEDKEKARVAVDIVASEFRRFYEEQQEHEYRDRRVRRESLKLPAMVIIDTSQAKPAPWRWPEFLLHLLLSSYGATIFALGLAIGLLMGTRLARRRASRV